jgi:hypothetical protein
VNLTAHDFATALGKHVAERHDNLVHQAIDGNPQDWAAYRETVGAIRELRAIADEMKRIARTTGDLEE